MPTRLVPSNWYPNPDPMLIDTQVIWVMADRDELTGQVARALPNDKRITIYPRGEDGKLTRLSKSSDNRDMTAFWRRLINLDESDDSLCLGIHHALTNYPPQTEIHVHALIWRYIGWSENGNPVYVAELLYASHLPGWPR